MSGGTWNSEASGSVRLALGGLIALAAAMGIGRFVYTPILPVMTDALGQTSSDAGLIASANFIGYLAGALLAASSRLSGSRRLFFVGALFVSAATTGLMGLTTNMTAFLLLRFAGGLASAFVLVFSSALVLDRLARAGRSGLVPVYFAGVGIGIAVSAVLIAALLAAGHDWRTMWIVSGFVSAVAVVAVFILVPGGADPPVVSAAGAGRMTRGLPMLIAAYGLFGFGYVITATFVVAIVRGAPDIAPLEPVIWVVVGVAAAPSVAIWVWIAGRVGDLRAFMIACLVEAVGVALSVVWVSPVAIIAAAVILGGTFMGITALGLAAGRRLTQGDARKTLGLMTASFGVGQIVGPVFAGYVSDVTGTFTAPSLTAAAALVIAAALVWRVRAY